MWAKLSIILLALSLGGCISLGGDDKEEKQTGLGERDIKYYSNKTVTSLEIPPDLTKPSSQGAFRISEYVKNVHEDVVSFTKAGVETNSKTTLKNKDDVQVKRSGDRRWLIVKKSPEDVWNLSKSFLSKMALLLKNPIRR